MKILIRLPPHLEAKMKTIKELLECKAQGIVHSIGPDETVFTAVTRMVEMNIGAILIIKAGSIKGIMTERDYLRFITEQGRTARDTPVSELMTRKIIYVTPDTPLNEVMTIMTTERIRHVPVLVDGELLGIVSIGDVVKQISQEQEVHIKTLEDYINDPYPGPAVKGKAD
jgi:signal-transduction protein with cAMP-binding, CBS, and nucleotidyltransferase domain